MTQYRGEKSPRHRPKKKQQVIGGLERTIYRFTTGRNPEDPRPNREAKGDKDFVRQWRH
ncbi:MAG: hypothetical protein ACRDHG_09260 [Anaerolineales bacterium]